MDPRIQKKVDEMKERYAKQAGGKKTSTKKKTTAKK